MLGWLLQALGFSLTHHQAVVGGVGPTNHMVLVVDVDGEPWIADAGLGEGFLDPLPLVPGPHDFGPFRWTVELEPCGTWWVAAHDWCSFPGFRMDEEASPVSAFEPHHRRLATDPESPFVKTLVVQRPRVDRITTLRARTLSVVGPDVDSKRVVADEAEFYAVLVGEFGVTRRDPRLWARPARSTRRSWRAKPCERRAHPRPPRQETRARAVAEVRSVVTGFLTRRGRAC